MAKFKVGDEVRRIGEPEKVLKVCAVGPWKAKSGEEAWYGLRDPHGETYVSGSGDPWIPKRLNNAWEHDLIAA